MDHKLLHRSITNRKIAGVAGGLAEYFNIDSSVVRFLWLLSIIIGGGGLFAYIIAWAVIPESTLDNSSTPIEKTQPTEVNSNASKNSYPLIGLLLIIVGGFFLIKEFLPWNLSRFTWPFILIALGFFVLIPRRKKLS